MNSRKLVGMFLKTLFIGGFVSLITSVFVKRAEFANAISSFDFMDLFGLIVFFIGLGFVFSIISQTGFFAYLFINRLGLSVFRSFWPTVQVVLIAFVVFDLVYFPYKGSDGEFPLYLLILMALSILGYGWIIARIKANQTHPRAFIPALFLMVVMTSIEWVPGLRASGTDYAWLMITTLLACNTYQLLILHHLTKEDGQAKNNHKKKTHEKNAKAQPSSSKA